MRQESSNSFVQQMASTISLNVANFVTLKLTPENYPLWREQMLALAESQDMVGLLTGEKIAPVMYTKEKTSPSEAETKEILEDFIKWRKEDCLLRGWIIGTLTEETLGLVIGLDTSHSVWNALKEAYAQDSQEREFTLRQQLTYLKKESHVSLAEHLRKFKSICDSLAAMGCLILDKTKAYSLLANLGQKYESFTTTMLKPPIPSYSEVVSLLQGFEQRSSWVETSNPSPYAFYGQRNPSQQQHHNHRIQRNNQFTSKGRGFQATNNSFQYSNFAGNNSGSHQKNDNRAPRPPPPGKRRTTTTEREMYKNEYCQFCGKPATSQKPAGVYQQILSALMNSLKHLPHSPWTPQSLIQNGPLTLVLQTT